MEANSPAASFRPSHSTGRRRVRRLHLWIGAWGALAAIVYGVTGLVMHHRFGDNPWPQGDSIESGKIVLAVPAPARDSAEALSLWLRDSHGLDAQSIRKGAPRGAPEDAPEQWTLSGGNARDSWAVQYQPGTDNAQVQHRHQSWLAALNRLHKTVGGGTAWVLLADSFALAMLLLGLSGIWMWARGRNPRQMAMSVFGAAESSSQVKKNEREESDQPKDPEDQYSRFTETDGTQSRAIGLERRMVVML